MSIQAKESKYFDLKLNGSGELTGTLNDGNTANVTVAPKVSLTAGEYSEEIKVDLINKETGNVLVTKVYTVTCCVVGTHTISVECTKVVVVPTLH